MRHYNAKSLEFVKEGFTDLFILSASNLPATAGGAPVNDFAAFAPTNVTLKNLVAGDIVTDVVLDVKTPVVGPSGVPTIAVQTATGAVTLVTAANLNAVTTAMTTATQGNTVNNLAAETLVATLNNGGGNGAAATAGEVWIWANIIAADRLKIQA